MNVRYGFSVFVASLRLGYREMLAEPLSLFGSFLTYLALIVAYGNVFYSIPAEDLARHHLTLSSMIWYFGATEFVLFCCSFSQFKEVQYDLQNDQIHLSLLRPCPPWIVRLGEWGGQSVARFFVLLIPCFALTGLMARDASFGVGRILGLAVQLPFSVLILLCSNFMIGVSCLWLKQADPVFWIWQKFLFLFGALLWPLSIYPEILRSLAWLTPFPSILAVPAEWFLDIRALPLIGGFVHQILWALILLAATAGTNGVMLRFIQKKGA